MGDSKISISVQTSGSTVSLSNVAPATNVLGARAEIATLVLPLVTAISLLGSEYSATREEMVEDSRKHRDWDDLHRMLEKREGFVDAFKFASDSDFSELFSCYLWSYFLEVQFGSNDTVTLLLDHMPRKVSREGDTISFEVDCLRIVE